LQHKEELEKHGILLIIWGESSYYDKGKEKENAQREPERICDHERGSVCFKKTIFLGLGQQGRGRKNL